MFAFDAFLTSLCVKYLIFTDDQNNSNETYKYLSNPYYKNVKKVVENYKLNTIYDFTLLIKDYTIYVKVTKIKNDIKNYKKWLKTLYYSKDRDIEVMILNDSVSRPDTCELSNTLIFESLWSICFGIVGFYLMMESLFSIEDYFFIIIFIFFLSYEIIMIIRTKWSFIFRLLK